MSATDRQVASGVREYVSSEVTSQLSALGVLARSWRPQRNEQESSPPKMNEVHVWRMIHRGSDQFAASDSLIACETVNEDEARTRAGWNAMSPKGEVSATYLGQMTHGAYDELLAQHNLTRNAKKGMDA